MVSLRILILGVFACLLNFSYSWGQLTTIVDVPQLGRIQGIQGVTSRDQTPYFVFHGIPYADPDSYMGVNRFKQSKIHDKPLTEDGSVFQANNILVYCPQKAILNISQTFPEDEIDMEDFFKVPELVQIYKSSFETKQKYAELYRNYNDDESRMKAFDEEIKVMGQEECLTLNINTPRIPFNDTDPLLPVVVFFHGGGSDSIWGSAFTGLRMMEEQNVVLVTMNYRLGVLGALNLGIDDAGGCQGPQDGITVLEWIKKNIKYFGGDPGSITITGQSAGAMMVSNLLVSPLTKDKDLFHRVWGFSGSSISVWAVSEEPSLPNHLRVAELAGCYNPQAPEDLQKVTECMQETTAENLVKAMILWQNEEEYEGRLGFDARMPSIQSPHLTIERFMPEHPYDILEKGEQRNVPLVLGATKHDGSFALHDIIVNYIKPHGHDKNETFMKNEMLPYLLQSLGIRDDTGELYHAMAKQYLGNASLTGTLPDKLPGLVDMVTVMAFKAGELETMKFHSRLSPKPNSYFYSFDYVGRWTLCGILRGANMEVPGGICHTDDLFYLFWLGPLLNDDMKVSRRFMDYFLNFVKYGDPNGEPGAEIVWEPYHSMNHPVLKIGRHDELVYNAEDHWTGNAKELFIDFPEEETSPPSTESTSPETTPNTETTDSNTDDTGPTTTPTTTTPTTTTPNTGSTSDRTTTTTTPNTSPTNPNTDDATTPPTTQHTHPTNPNTDDTDEPTTTTTTTKNTGSTEDPISTTPSGGNIFISSSFLIAISLFLSCKVSLM